MLFSKKGKVSRSGEWQKREAKAGLRGTERLSDWRRDGPGRGKELMQGLACTRMWLLTQSCQPLWLCLPPPSSLSIRPSSELSLPCSARTVPSRTPITCTTSTARQAQRLFVSAHHRPASLVLPVIFWLSAVISLPSILDLLSEWLS